MQCDRSGITLATLPLRPGFWRATNRTASMYECGTVGNVSACLGGSNSSAYCANGHEGPLCASCSDADRWYDAETATCKSCSDLVTPPIRQTTILLAIVSAFAVLRALVVRAPRLLSRTSRKVGHAAIAVVQGLENFGATTKFKIVIFFYQVWAVRETVYGFALPPELGAWLAALEVSFNFDVAAFIFPSWTCIGGLPTRLIFNALWPFMVMILLVPLIVGYEMLKKPSYNQSLLKGAVIVHPRRGQGTIIDIMADGRRAVRFDTEHDIHRYKPSSLYKLRSAQSKAEAHTRAFHAGVLRCVQLFVLLSFCVLPAVTRSLFLAFHCESYGFDDFTSTSKLHLTASLDIECGSAEHQRIVDLAGFFIFLWPVAMPLLYALLLWKARHAIRHHQPTFLYPPLASFTTDTRTTTSGMR
jgi:hypothetical protein